MVRIKIPRHYKKIKDAEGIEVGRGQSRRGWDGPSYVVRVLVEDERPKVLGVVNITRDYPHDPRGSGQTRYTVSGDHSFSGDYPFSKNMVKIEKEGSLDEAKQVAHNLALEIAEKIAKANNLPLEDKVSEEELANEMDSLPFRKGRLTIFTLSIIAGVALSLSSLSTTGNAVSNLTRTTPGLLGIILFIAGLSGMFFHFKGK